MKPAGVLAIAAVLAGAPACHQPATRPAAPPTPTTPTAPELAPAHASEPAPTHALEPAPAPAPTPATAPTPALPPAADPADEIVVYAIHVPPKATDPVELRFERFSVVKASFDPKQIEGGTAMIAIDLTSLKTDNEKRDAHLASPDYLDTKKFATATVQVSKVKQKADRIFTALAAVKLHGVQKTYPVEFEVVEVKDDRIRIQARHGFSRLDFKVGRKPGEGPMDDRTGDGLIIKLQLTLKKT